MCNEDDRPHYHPGQQASVDAAVQRASVDAGHQTNVNVDQARVDAGQQASSVDAGQGSRPTGASFAFRLTLSCQPSLDAALSGTESTTKPYRTTKMYLIECSYTLVCNMLYIVNVPLQQFSVTPSPVFTLAMGYHGVSAAFSELVASMALQSSLS